jgi:hypothetical protein
MLHLKILWHSSFYTHLPAYEDGTDRVFRNAGMYISDAGELPKRKHTRLYVTSNPPESELCTQTLRQLCWLLLTFIQELSVIFIFANPRDRPFPHTQNVVSKTHNSYLLTGIMAKGTLGHTLYAIARRNLVTVIRLTRDRNQTPMIHRLLLLYPKNLAQFWVFPANPDKFPSGSLFLH